MTTINTYAMIQGGDVINIVGWDGNTDLSTGGWQPPSGVTMALLSRYPQIGDKATQDASGAWDFSAA